MSRLRLIPGSHEARVAQGIAAHRRRLARIERATRNATQLNNVAAPWVNLSFASGHFAAGGNPMQCYKNTFGHVYCRGEFQVNTLSPSPTVADTLLTFPAGYRPPFYLDGVSGVIAGYTLGTLVHVPFDIWPDDGSSDAGKMFIFTNGNMPSTGMFLEMDSIQFRTL